MRQFARSAIAIVAHRIARNPSRLRMRSSSSEMRIVTSTGCDAFSTGRIL